MTCQLWETPGDFWTYISARYTFDVDVCATEQSTKCARFISPDQDGLSVPWGSGKGFAWCNPPFKCARKWHEKAVHEIFSAQHISGAAVLGHACTGAAWWQQVVRQYAPTVLLLSPRISFVDPATGCPKSGNDRDSMLTIYHRADDPRRHPNIKLCQWKGGSNE